MSQVTDYNSYKNATQRMQDSFDTERTEARTNHEKEVKQTKEEAEAEIQTAKKEYNQRLENERAQARDEVKRLKDELYDNSGKNSAREMKDTQALKHETDRYREEVKAEADRRVALAEERVNNNSARQKDLENDKVEAALAAQKKATHQQINALEDELAEYRNSSRDVSSERANARQESISENEKQVLDDRRRIIEGYERQIASMKSHEDDMAQHYDRQLTDTVFASNMAAQNQIKNQKNEFERIQKDSNAEKNNLEKTFNAEVSSLRKRQERSSDHLISQNSDNLTRVAEDKDKTYQNYLAQKDEKYLQDVKERDAKIQQLATTDDPLKVSPFVVKKITDASDSRNYKLLTESQNVYDKNLNATRTKDQEDRKALLESYQASVTGLSRESRKEQDLANRQFQGSYSDLQNLHQTEVANLKDSKRDLTERMYQKHALALSGAQKDKQEALTEQRDSMTYQKNAALDDADLSSRTKDREWFMRTNELRRNFETKLNEERDQHDKVSSQLKLENDKKLRDQDRVSKRTLEDQKRAYEHQITQQELAFKEKERFLTEHYEEELDKMKRTNAHLIQKKS